MRALCQLSLGLALAALKRAPQSLLRRTTAPHLKCELLDQDEMLVDAAIDGKVSKSVFINFVFRQNVFILCKSGPKLGHQGSKIGKRSFLKT